MNGVEEVPEEGEIDSNSAAPNKVHIRGLDRLNTHDIRQYAAEHYSMDLFSKVEWIDDSSANLIYDTPAAAAEALVALSAEEASELLQIRTAKPFSTYPDVELQVRQAIIADVKVQGAKDRSRFYLMNPRWDPDNPDNERPGFKRRRVDPGYGHNKYRRRDHEPDRRRLRGPREQQSDFHEDMYGEDPQATSDSSRRNSISSDGEYVKLRRNRQTNGDHGRERDRGGDLFASRQNGRLRNRSASPSRDEDGRYGFADDQPYRQTARARSRTPPNVRNGGDNRRARNDLSKELFPERQSSAALTNGNGHSNSMDDLRPSSSASNRELFPNRLPSPTHRRQAAKHIDADEVAKAIGRCSMDEQIGGDAFTYTSSGRRPDTRDQSENGVGRDLFARIEGGPESSFGRLNGTGSGSGGGGGSGGGFSFKGAGNAGFSILGASNQRAQSPLVKELFPLKAGGTNGRRELFDGRVKGRAGRARAEDYD